MISARLTRCAQALLLAAFLAALAAQGAFASSSPGRPTPDWIERYAAAHPYGQGSVDRPAPAIPDWIERYAAAHPYGQGIAPGAVDGRSPDTRFVGDDARLQLVDRRSPDAREPALSRSPVVVAEDGGVGWGNAGIAAGLASAILAVLAGSMLLWSRRHTRERVRMT